MLVWINGPFGGGKTVTAFELARRCSGAVVCDPEEVGFGLRRAMPREVWGDDFQDLRAWRVGVVEVLDLTLRGHDGPVVAPMTLVEPAYVDEVIGSLRGLGHEVRHVALVSSSEEVRRRLAGRGIPGLKRDLWALAQSTVASRRSPSPASPSRSTPPTGASPRSQTRSPPWSAFRSPPTTTARCAAGCAARGPAFATCVSPDRGRATPGRATPVMVV